MSRGRWQLVAGYVLLGVLGFAVGVLGAFLVPVRLPGGVEGVADVVGLAGPWLVGYYGAVGLASAPAAVLPGLGWILSVLVLNGSRGGDVIIPGGLPNDPGVATVGAIYLVSGLLATLLAGLLAGRTLRRRLVAQASPEARSGRDLQGDPIRPRG
jgi:hypothetical protein